MKKIVILSGAGISQPSGLETFRSDKGLWNKHNINDIANYDSFIKNPKLVHEFYNNRRQEINNSKPNTAHSVISELQNKYDVEVFTQNIDDLHERSGSNKVFHFHGTHNTMLCISCKNKFIFNNIWNEESKCVYCNADWKNVRPDIVWFGEQLDLNLFYRAEDSIRNADLYIQIGTSAKVQPVCNLFKKAKPRKKRIEVNLEKSNPRRPFDFHGYYIGDVIKSIEYLKNDIEYLMSYPEKPTNKKF